MNDRTPHHQGTRRQIDADAHVMREIAAAMRVTGPLSPTEFFEVFDAVRMTPEQHEATVS